MDTGCVKSLYQKGLIFKFNSAGLVYGSLNDFNLLAIFPIQ